MRRMTHRIISTGAALAAVAFLVGTANAGPPWISIEIPANPHNPSTRDALFTVHTYHHSDVLTVPMRATAEGLVGGVRRSLPIELVKTNQPGVYAVRGKIPADGTWLVAVTLNESENSSATALVSMRANGQVAGVKVPSTRDREGWVIPSRVTREDIESELRAAAHHASADHSAPGYATVGALGALLLVAAIAQMRRRVAR